MKLINKKTYKETPKLIETIHTWEAKRQDKRNIKDHAVFQSILIVALILAGMICGRILNDSVTRNPAEHKLIQDIPVSEERYIQPDVDYFIEKKAMKYQVDAILVKSIIQHESRHYKFAKGSADDVGVMQVRLINMNKKELAEPFEYDNNVDAGVRYLKGCIEKHSKLDKSISCYNMGLNGNYNSKYVKQVCTNYLYYAKMYNKQTNKNFKECEKQI